MKLSGNQAKFLTEVIEHWNANGIITDHQGKELKSTFEIKTFDWKSLATYSFWFALLSGIIAIISVIADDWVQSIIKGLLQTSHLTIAILTAILAAFVFYLGKRYMGSYPNKIYSYESIFFLGIVLTWTSIGFLGAAIDSGSGHFSILILLGTLVSLVLAILLPSKLVWIFALLSLGIWFGAETGYLSEWDTYFLGLSYQVRFAFLGFIVVCISASMVRSIHTQAFQEITYVLGMLCLFISLWLISFLGNFGNLGEWNETPQIRLAYWAVFLMGGSFYSIYHGLKKDDAIARGFGVTFVILGIYTKYFEFLWEELHAALFFFIMGLSFWLLGKKAETIWTISFLSNQKGSKK